MGSADSIDQLNAVTTNPQEWSEKAKRYLNLAKEIGRASALKSRHNRNHFLSNAPQFQTNQQIKLTILSAEAFRICGEHHWYDSAQAYSRAATLHADALHDPMSAAELFTEAGIVMEQVDTNFANEHYRKAVSQYCDSSQYNNAALLQERMANNFEKKGDPVASIEEYQRAAKLFGAAKSLDRADRVLERAAYLLGITGKFRESAYAYQGLAIGQSNQNLKKFNVPRLMLRGSILLLRHCISESTEQFNEVIEFVERMYCVDCRFKESGEHDFIVDVIECIRRNDLDIFADCVYFYYLYSDFDDLMLTTLDGIKEFIAVTKLRKDTQTK